MNNYSVFKNHKMRKAVISFVMFLISSFGLFGLVSCGSGETYKRSVKEYIYATNTFSNDLIYGEIIQLCNHDSYDGYISGGFFRFNGNISENQYFTGLYKNAKGEILVFKMPVKRVKIIDSDQYVLATSNFYNYIDAYIEYNCVHDFYCRLSSEEVKRDLIDIINNVTNTTYDNYMTQPYLGGPRLWYCGLPTVEIRIPIKSINNFIKIDYSNNTSSTNNKWNSGSKFWY